MSAPYRALAIAAPLLAAALGGLAGVIYGYVNDLLGQTLATTLGAIALLAAIQLATHLTLSIPAALRPLTDAVPGRTARSDTLGPMPTHEIAGATAAGLCALIFGLVTLIASGTLLMGERYGWLVWVLPMALTSGCLGLVLIVLAARRAGGDRQVVLAALRARHGQRSARMSPRQTRKQLEAAGFTIQRNLQRFVATDARGRRLLVAIDKRGARIDLNTFVTRLGDLTARLHEAYSPTPGLWVSRTDPRLLYAPAVRALVRFVLEAGGRVEGGDIDWRPTDWSPTAEYSPHTLLDHLEAALTVEPPAPVDEPDRLARDLAADPDPLWRLARVEALARRGVERSIWSRLLSGPSDVRLTTQIVFPAGPISAARVTETLGAADVELDSRTFARAIAGICDRIEVANPAGLAAIGDAFPETRPDLVGVLCQKMDDPEGVLARWLADLPARAVEPALAWCEAHGTERCLGAIAAWLDHPDKATRGLAIRADRAIRGRAFPGGAGALALAALDREGALTVAEPDDRGT